MSDFQIKKATRQGVKPLIGVYGESGCGKTYSALLLARGIVGPDGLIVLGDSESGRGSLYADVLPGGYSTLELSGPFSPARYIEVIAAIEKSGAQIGILDSASHEWEGIGGVLDMAGENESRSGKPGLHNWKTPKMEHAKFMLRMMQSSIPWIVCLRAKYKSRQIKNDRGKTEIVKDDHTSPIQAEDFIFEMTAHFEVMPDHTIHLTKHSHPALKDCFPEDYKKPVGVEHGKLIAEWCAGGTGPKPQTGSASDAKALRASLWALVKHRFANGAELEQWLWDEGIMVDTENLQDMEQSRLKALIETVKAKLK